ncbi:DEAD/DEAH box helicase [Paraburkholderia sp. MM5482-R1]|uniref:DEAD/DEAH box helicase n=1 Tax=unclassified Paraburkholderia TaxID=2615204 RepID=UPI003D214AA4
MIDIDEIDGAVRYTAEGWFDLEMGVLIDQRVVRLEPLLAELCRTDKRWLGGDLEGIPDEESIVLRMEDGQRLRVLASRLKPIVRVLIDLLTTEGNTTLRVHRYDFGRLSGLTDTARWSFHGDQWIHSLAERIHKGTSVADVTVPATLKTELRDYQLYGLAWMQFLRANDLGGILADDMGLGKTVQAIAHLLIEKEAGRMDHPSLIVVPTTLVHNWKEEIAKFAPSLRTLALSGSNRKLHFDHIDSVDVVVTTYPLLWRDEAIVRHEYHLLIIDEAQYVKNATSKTGVALRGVTARHRMCLTGTPVENNLTELWARFDFLLPRFLSSRRDFTSRWRGPIEKHGDEVCRALLGRRIKPFVLRRKKEEVATELPKKTIVISKVELSGEQRDLYESVRIAMQVQVQAAISESGPHRSHIIVLAAILKLRQVCCDPRLLKNGSTRTAAGSAKLDLAVSMICELVEAGRHVLVYSQFTEMLDLLAESLDAAGVLYVMLTGQTGDRVTPVDQFQSGRVPLFLISLKAGGVGVNLTAADTVIHYDPWWNPAAENQATSRAHRIGQNKPVFAYKLIVAGSIEEKILELQGKSRRSPRAYLARMGQNSLSSPRKIFQRYSRP